LATLFFLARFQYGDLHFGHHVGSSCPLGGHSCSQRSHFQYQTIFFTFAMRRILARKIYDCK
jgi:hypothetical protein